MRILYVFEDLPDGNGMRKIKVRSNHRGQLQRQMLFDMEAVLAQCTAIDIRHICIEQLQVRGPHGKRQNTANKISKKPELLNTKRQQYLSRVLYTLEN